jgi:hypothetical protein
MSYRNFIQDNNAQNGFWPSLLQRYPKRESKEIYFVFFPSFIQFATKFGILYYFLGFI